MLASRENRAGALKAITFGSPGFWLLLTTLYATMTAYVMPRLFQGQTFAFAVRAQGPENYALPLAPTTSNLTQSVYLIGDCVCFLALVGFGGSEAGRRCLGRAALACVILNLVFAALDLTTYMTGTTELMSFIRNSTYSLLSDTELAGFKRIVGSFVEASSFGYWTLGYCAFATSLWLNGVAPRLTLSLSMLSLVALLFSTSTTAYVGLSVYLFAQLVLIAYNAMVRPVRPQMILFAVALPFAISLLVILICLNDASYAYFADLLNTLVFDKLSTSSGIERSSWNSQAIQNFLDTYGFGAGNGSVRASSFPIAVIASLGILGGTTYALFLLTIYFRKERAAAAGDRSTAGRGQIGLFCLAHRRLHVGQLHRSRTAVFRLCRAGLCRSSGLAHQPCSARLERPKPDSGRIQDVGMDRLGNAFAAAASCGAQTSRPFASAAAQ